MAEKEQARKENSFSVTGGTVNARNIAVGPHARAGDTVSHAPVPSEELAEARELLRRLEEALTANREPLADLELVRESTAAIGAQLDREEPSRTGLTARLGALAAGIGSVTGLTEAVTALSVAVERLFWQ